MILKYIMFNYGKIMILMDHNIHQIFQICEWIIIIIKKGIRNKMESLT